MKFTSLLPRFSHARHFEPEKPRVEYLPAADCFRATLWIYWTWRGRGHRVMVSLPDFLS
jgi:hypothetical protein